MFFKLYFSYKYFCCTLYDFPFRCFLLSSSQHHDAHLVLIPVLMALSENSVRKAFSVAQTFATSKSLFCFFFSSQCCLIIPFSCTVCKAPSPIRTLPPGLVHPPISNVISLVFPSWIFVKNHQYVK